MVKANMRMVLSGLFIGCRNHSSRRDSKSEFLNSGDESIDDLNHVGNCRDAPCFWIGMSSSCGMTNR